MKNGYQIKWTDHALNELSATYRYLELHFTELELKKFLLNQTEHLD